MPALYWHVRYFQQNKEDILPGAAEIMEAAGFHDPVIGELEVSGAKGDVSAFIGAIWQREGPESEPPFWTIVIVAAGGEAEATVNDLQSRWGPYWFTPNLPGDGDNV